MSSTRRAWIPNQHGAWAMLITPVLVGAAIGGPDAWHGLLLIAWLAAYCAHYFGGLALKSRRPSRYRWQLLAYGAVLTVSGMPLVIHAPRLLLLIPPALIAFAVNLAFIVQRNERAWVNDAVGIVLAALVGIGAVSLGTTPTVTSRALLVLACVAWYFMGTVVYVKTLIRERGSAAWYRASVLLHTAYVVICAALGWWVLSAVSTGLLARAALVPGHGWTPKRVGLLEIGWTLLVSCVAIATIHG